VSASRSARRASVCGIMARGGMMSVGSLMVLLMETTLVISAYKEFSSVGCVKRADRRGTGGFR